MPEFARFRNSVAAVSILIALSISSSAAELPPLHRGVNTFPWLYRARTINNDGLTFDYSHPFPYFDQYQPQNFSALREAGIDFVRAIIEPGPLLAADPQQRASLVDTILKETRKAADLGLTVIIDPHPREDATTWGSMAILTKDDVKARYEAMIVAFAQALVREGKGHYVLELMNEPPGGYGWRDNYGWREFQARLIKAIRLVAPSLPILVTGDRGGGSDGLFQLDAAAIDDPAILYSFHYYLPMVVTHQGAKWTSQAYRQYLSGVPYPPVPEQLGPILAHVHDAILGDKSLDEQSQAKIWGAAQTALQDYFRNPAAAKTIQTDFAQVASWAKTSHIPASRIVLGEFGVFRPAASLDTAAAWTHDVRTASEANGFAWAFFNYQPIDEDGRGFSLLEMSGSQPRAFSPQMLQYALGLNVPAPK